MAFEVRAVAKYIPLSAHKVRLVAELVEGRRVEDALAMLDFVPRAAAKALAKAIHSATANAEENYSLSRQDLYVVRVVADEGPTLKRGYIGARARFKRILRRSSHITVVLSELEEKEA